MVRSGVIVHAEPVNRENRERNAGMNYSTMQVGLQRCTENVIKSNNVEMSVSDNRQFEIKGNR